MVWQAWAPVAGGVTLPGAPITALPSGEQLAVFVAGYPSPGAGTTGGAVYAIEGTPGGWGNWAPVCDHLTLTGAPVGAVKLPPPVNEMQEQFALFIADPLGGIYATDGDPQEGWWCWESVSGGQTLPGAPVTAVTWRKQAAIFFADPIGGIYANRGTPEGGWGDWRIVCGDRSTLPGAPVTALPLPTGVQRPGEELGVFMADRNGGVYATSGSVRWRCWGSVLDGIAVPGSKVTAVRWTDQQFALFVVSPNGGVYTTGGTPRGGWSNWLKLPDVNTSARSGIAAIEWPWTNQLAVFTTDFGSGTVRWILGDPQQGFGMWSDVNAASLQGTGIAPVTAVLYGDPPNGAAVFVADYQGAIQATSWLP